MNVLKYLLNFTEVYSEPCEKSNMELICDALRDLVPFVQFKKT